MEVPPQPTYSVAQEKFRASVGWLCCKVLGTDVPDDLQTLFLEDGTISPAIAEWLISGEPYCQLLAVSNLPGDLPSCRQERLLQALVSKGKDLMSHQRFGITAEELVARPIRPASHQALLDDVMTVWAEELLRVEKVECSAPQLTSQSGRGSPDCLEKALLRWILENRVRYPDCCPCEDVPKPQSLMKAINVTSLLHLLGCYCPELRHTEYFGMGRSVEGQTGLLLKFIRNRLQIDCPLSVQDFMVASEELKPNFLAFMAELFWQLERGKLPRSREGLIGGEELECGAPRKPRCVTAPLLSRSPVLAQPPSMRSGRSSDAQRSRSRLESEGKLSTEGTLGVEPWEMWSPLPRGSGGGPAEGAAGPGPGGWTSREEGGGGDLEARRRRVPAARSRDPRLAQRKRDLRNSYIVSERPHTPESARDSGLPIVGVAWRGEGHPRGGTMDPRPNPREGGPRGQQEHTRGVGSGEKGLREQEDPTHGVGSGEKYLGEQDNPDGGVGSGLGEQDDPDGGVGTGRGEQEDPDGGVGSGLGEQEAPDGGVGSDRGEQEDPDGGVGSGRGEQEDPDGGVRSGLGEQEDPDGGVGSDRGEQDNPDGGVGSGLGEQDNPDGGIGSGRGEQEDPDGGVRSGLGEQEDPDGGVGSGLGEQEDPDGGVGSDRGEQEDPDGGVGSGRGEQEDPDGGVRSGLGEQEDPDGGVGSDRGEQDNPDGGVGSGLGEQEAPDGGVRSGLGEQEDSDGGVRSGLGEQEDPDGGIGSGLGEQEDPDGGVRSGLGEQEDPDGGIGSDRGEQEAPDGGVRSGLGEQEDPDGGIGSGRGEQEDPDGGIGSGRGEQEDPDGGIGSGLGEQEDPDGGVGSDRGEQEDPDGGVGSGRGQGLSRRFTYVIRTREPVTPDDGGAVRVACCGRQSASTEAEGPQDAGRLSEGPGAKVVEPRQPRARKPTANPATGEETLPGNDGLAAEQPQVGPLARRRAQLVEWQQRRARPARLQQGQQEAAASRKRAGLRLQRTDVGRATRLNPGRTVPEDKVTTKVPGSIPPPAEQTGLKLFKEPSAKSNRLILHNALNSCCLAGKANIDQRNQVIEALMKCKQNQCLILFRDYQCQFRALYCFCPETEEILRLCGVGPRQLTPEMITGLYKYNSNHKQFHAIPSRTLSASIDALTIHGHLWQGRKRGALGSGLQ
uniref:calmodulin-regulated spectrin-associated protein 3-like n=1 Tax=Pristiophorus japonicus TaxID=55135 RepID=UPI00398F5D68